MVTCSDRQLAQTARVDAFSSTRGGVARAVRAFQGEPSGKNLMDYINRELFPAVKQGRDKLNEVFLQVADNAPSANPLSYFFATSTANADPTTGRTRLNNATQNLATVVRISETNSKLISAVAWLDVMAGSSTVPIGVITMADAKDPRRFVRWNLDTMVDQGTYWDLGVTPIESSHDNPFVEDEPVLISFIAGVASGGVVIGPGSAPAMSINLVTMATAVASNFGALTLTNVTANTLNLLLPVLGVSEHSRANVFFGASSDSLVAIARMVFRGGTFAGFGSDISFSNANGISFGIESSLTAASQGRAHILTANFAGPRAISAAGSSITVGTAVWSNSNNVSFGMNGGTITASATVASTQGSIRISAGTTNGLASAFSFADSNNVSFGLSGSTVTGSYAMRFDDAVGSVSVSQLSFVDMNGVSFGLDGNELTASMLPTIGLISHVGGNSVSNVTRLAFSNASNVTWSVSTAAAAATVFASVAAGGGGGITALALSNAASSVAATGITFSNANGFSFLLSTAAGNAATISGSYTVPAAQTFIGGIAGGTQTATSGTIVFSNSNNISFGLSGSTRMTAIAAFSGIQAGTQTGTASTIVFSDSNGIGFGMSGSTRVTASFDGVRNIQAGVSAINGSSALSFSNGSNVSFGLGTSAGVMVITASVDRDIGLISHVGGNSVAGATRLAFSNASNVTFSLSTAAGAATLFASVAAGGGGGVVISASGAGSVTSGTAVFSNDAALSAALLNTARMGLGCVAFTVTNGSVISAAAGFVVNDNGAGGFLVSNMEFINGNGLSFGVGTTTNASGSVARVTASRERDIEQISCIGGTGDASAGSVTRLIFSGNGGVTFNLVTSANVVRVRASVQAPPDVVWWDNYPDKDDPTTIGMSNLESTGRLFPLSPMGPWFGNMTISSMDIMLTGASHSSTQGTNAWAVTIRGGLYTLAASTQLSLLNSFSTVISSTTIASANSATRNNLVFGARWLTVGTGAWSSSPVLTHGGQYWMGLWFSNSGATRPINDWVAQRVQNAPSFRGYMSVSNTNVVNTGNVPFRGNLATGSPPTSIGSNAAGLSGTAASGGYVPVIQFRAGVSA